MPIFLKIDSTDQKDDFYVKYYIGACYLNTKYQRTKGIPYLEFAVENGEKFLPKEVFYDLSQLYHLNYQFLKSEKMLQQYFKLADKKDSSNIRNAQELILMDSLALVLQKDSEKYEVSALPYPINTGNSEKIAFISADNNVLFFTRILHKYSGDLLIDSVRQIMMSVKEKDQWGTPQPISIQYDKKKYVSPPQLVGISFDARYLFFKMNITPENGDLFVGELHGTECSLLEPLPEGINSLFDEGAISFTPDGDVCYFSSNRPGGYGEMDLYMSVKTDSRKWDNPKNLGPMINSSENENFPFIHPNGKRLYFASDITGKIIGGYDIFVSNFSVSVNDWTDPQNMGFPINTPSDDISFVPNAEGNLAYYSSAKNNETGDFNLYVVRLEQSIPLTLVKGFIYESDTKNPIPAQIKVYDATDSRKIKYIYNPNPETGKYLMIFPPGRDYDMVVQAKGYYDHLIKIHVPYQSYFYELYQEIRLKPIFLKIENKKLGEEIEVNNIFYDTERFFKNDTLQLEKISQSKNYEPLLNLVGDIISFTDSMGLEYVNNMYAKENQTVDTSKNYNKLMGMVEDAINTTDSALLQKINNETVYKEKTNQRFFYNQLDSNKILTPHILGNDTFWIASSLNTVKSKYEVSNPFKTKKDSLNKNVTSHEKTKTIDRISYFFASGKFVVSHTYQIKLIDLITFLLNNPSLMVEIVGYADSDGNKKENMDLSYKRAFEISRTMKEQGVNKTRIKIKGMGEPKKSEKTQKEKQQNRRVDIIIQEKYFD
ncbi:MAG: hypothetical protein DRP35_10875 [Candidatus Zixiibacteriota bacterium]|nr:MAG: hypothetical protein DRP35_10875 [candidate division Zixibacteria bacterium]